MRFGITSCCFVAALLGLGACEPSKPEPAPTAVAEPSQKEAQALTASSVRARAAALFQPLPSEAPAQGRPLTEARIALGRQLYFDTRLSKNHDLACVSCHALDGFGVDPRPDAREKGTSFGHKGQFGDRNTPSVFNAAIHLAQFWDGRATDLEEQATGPVLNPVEMAMPDADSVVAVLQSIPGYAPAFAAAFPDDAEPISFANMATAIAAFERKLMTPGPFDRFLAGDDSALSAEQLEGLSLFMDAGCIACHNGAGLGGAMYQKLGLMKPYPTGDEGRFAVTKQESDKFFFKVPSLRNVEKTGPYFHDGSIKTLTEAIALMSEYQTPGGKLSAETIARIEAFLSSLTATPPAELLVKPELPESGPKTPRPDPS